MKKFLSASIIASIFFVAFCLTLSGCASNRYPYPNNKLTQENWVNAVDKNPIKWTRGADRWFLTGEPNATELANRHAPESAGITTMMVKAPDFNSIKVEGDFQVQIFGTYENNSVYVYGPNKAVRSVLVQVNHKTLCVTQEQSASRSIMKGVIIRIGVNYLTRITQLGCGLVEGIRLHSDALYVNSSGAGNMYLAGNVNLRQVGSTGVGSVTVFGVNTGDLIVQSHGSGNINVSGNVGIKSIIHRGTGDINVIGANSNSNCPMKIDTSGSGKIGLSGRAAIAEIIAKGDTSVFACQTASRNTNVYVFGNACVALVGVGKNLFVETNNNSQFMGRRLCVENAFVRAHDHSHINVSASNKIFAAATQSASVYFYGEPKLMSQFISGNGVVIPIWTSTYRSCAIVERPVRSYKGEG